MKRTFNESAPKSAPSESLTPSVADTGCLNQEMKQSFRSSRHVIILAGPGGTGFGSKHVSSFSQSFLKHGSTVTVVGNGDCTITYEEIRTNLVQASKQASELLIFVLAHGEYTRGKHYINFTGEFELLSEDFFKMITNDVSRRVDIFLTCCNGGAAIQAVKMLPKGSGLVTLSAKNELVHSSSIDRFMLGLLKHSALDKDLSLDYLFNLYLTQALKNRFSPNYSVSGQSHFDLQSKFRNIIGVDISDDDAMRAHQKLDSFIDTSEVDRILEKIKNSASEYDICAAEFGTALAITRAIKRPLLYSRTVKHRKFQLPRFTSEFFQHGDAGESKRSVASYAFGFFSSLNEVLKDRRFAVSAQEGELYRAHSIIYIKDETLMRMGFSLDQVVRGQERYWHTVIINQCQDLALPSAADSQDSSPVHEESANANIPVAVAVPDTTGSLDTAF